MTLPLEAIQPRIAPPRSSVEGTSAAGAMFASQVRGVVFVGALLVAPGMSTMAGLPTDPVLLAQRALQSTTAGASAPLGERAGAAIGELRRLSGLTWEQLARLCTVSRRSLHFWASGKPMGSSNEEHLQRLLGVLRKVDRGGAQSNRTALLAPLEDGRVPLDLLANGEYERVSTALSKGPAGRVAPPVLSAEARAARKPRPPEELVDALQDRAHREAGSARPARSVKVRGGT